MATQIEVKKRNEEIIKYIADGKSIEWVAEEFDLSPATIRYHMRSPDMVTRLMKVSKAAVIAYTPEAVKVLYDVMSDEKSGAKVRMDAAKAIIQFSGLEGLDSSDKDHVEMSMEQLDERIAKLERLENAKTIDGEVLG